MLFAIGAICSLASLVCWVVILIAAFQEEVIQGILCFCVPFYILYYALARYQGDKKGLLIAVGLGGGIVGGILQSIGGGS